MVQLDPNDISPMLDTLFSFDPETRGIKRPPTFSLSDSKSIKDLMETVVESLAPLLGTSESQLFDELAEWFRYRTIFALLPHEGLFGNTLQTKPIIRDHLIKLGIEPTDSLVRAIKFYCTNFSQKKEGYVRKISISDVYAKNRNLYSKLFEQQGGRCNCCGKPLIFGENAQLDHLLPWHLGDDPPDGSNWQFLCDVCNRGKGEFPHYVLSRIAANWIGPSNDGLLREDVRYAALIRDRKCTKCGKIPKEAQLGVQKRISSGCWVLDNAVALCVDCAPLGGFL